MTYDESTKSYQYVRIDGSLISLQDPFPNITKTYINSDSEWNPEDKISWDEIAPSLQELILKSRIIEWNELDDEIQNKLHLIDQLSESLSTEINERTTAVVMIQSQLDKLVNLETRLKNTESEIANLWLSTDDLQNIVEGCTREIDYLKERIENIEDRVEQIERQLDLLWKEIYFLWGGELKDWLRYKNKKWDLPRVWFDLWFLWSRDATYNVYREENEDFNDLTNQEESYEADYLRHKLHKNIGLKNSWNIPHIWDELWWLWGGITNIGNSNTLLAQNAENENEIIFNTWRNHSNTIYVDTDKTSSETRLHNLNIPNIWRDLWWTWNADPDFLVDSVDESDTTKGYPLANIDKWSTADTNREENHNLWRHWINPATNRYITIPNIWRDLWWLWGGINDIEPESTTSDLANQDAYNQWRTHQSKVGLDYDKLSTETRLHNLNIPNIWRDLWWTWNADPDELVSDVDRLNVKNGYDAWMQYTDTNRENDYSKWRNHINPSNNKFLTIPNIWRDLWYIWSQFPDDNANADPLLEEEYTLWKTFLIDTRETHAIHPTIPNLLKEIWHIWSNQPTDFIANINDMRLVNNDFLTNSKKEWNIPHIWDNIYFLWGGTEAAFENNKKTEWDIPHIWAAIEQLDASNIWKEIYFLWGGEEADFNRNRAQAWDIPHIWEALNKLGAIDPVTKPSCTEMMAKKMDITDFNREGTKIWAAISNKVDNPVYVIEVNKIWEAINELRKLVLSMNGVVEIMRETWIAHNSGNVNVSTNVHGSSGCGGSCGGSCGGHSGTTTSGTNLNASSKLLGAIKDLAGYPYEDNEGDNSAMEIIYNDESSADDMPVYGIITDDGNSGNCYGSSILTDFGESVPTGVGDYAWYVKSPNGNGANLKTDSIPYYFIGTAYKSYQSSSSTQFKAGKLYVYQSGCIFFKFSQFDGVTADGNYHYFQFPLPLIAWPTKGVKTVGNPVNNVAINGSIENLINNYATETNYWGRIASTEMPVKNVSAFACKFTYGDIVGDNIIHLATDNTNTVVFPYLKGLAHMPMTEETLAKGYFGVFYSYGLFTNGIPKLTVDVNAKNINQYPKSTDDFWAWFKFNHQYYPITENTVASEPIRPILFGTNYNDVVNTILHGKGDDGLKLLKYT